MNRLTDQPDPLYYLHNFTRTLNWLSDRYGDLLNSVEHGFIERFNSPSSQAMLMRLIMREGLVSSSSYTSASSSTSARRSRESRARFSLG